MNMSNKGLTFVELMVVLAIMGIIIIPVSNFFGSMVKSQKMIPQSDYLSAVQSVLVIMVSEMRNAQKDTCVITILPSATPPPITGNIINFKTIKSNGSEADVTYRYDNTKKTLYRNNSVFIRDVTYMSSTDLVFTKFNDPQNLNTKVEQVKIEFKWNKTYLSSNPGWSMFSTVINLKN